MIRSLIKTFDHQQFPFPHNQIQNFPTFPKAKRNRLQFKRKKTNKQTKKQLGAIILDPQTNLMLSSFPLQKRNRCPYRRCAGIYVHPMA